MTAATADPFAKFKAAQREGWSSFAPVEIMTTTPAAKLVKFAQVAPGQQVLDVACGTGVVAVTAARRGARSSRPRSDAGAARARARERRALPASTSSSLKATPRRCPIRTLRSTSCSASSATCSRRVRPWWCKEMLRVLKRGGRIAFSTWPPEHFTGRMFAFIARNMPPPPAGAEPPAPPPLWGDPEHHPRAARRGGDRSQFARDTLVVPALSLRHFRAAQEKTIGPLTKLVASLQNDPAKLAAAARRIRCDGRRRFRRQHHPRCRS